MLIKYSDESDSPIHRLKKYGMHFVPYYNLADVHAYDLLSIQFIS